MIDSGEGFFPRTSSLSLCQCVRSFHMYIVLSSGVYKGPLPVPSPTAVASLSTSFILTRGGGKGWVKRGLAVPQLHSSNPRQIIGRCDRSIEICRVAGTTLAVHSTHML